jgi:hypothetical protein
LGPEFLTDGGPIHYGDLVQSLDLRQQLGMDVPVQIRRSTFAVVVERED